MSIKIGHARSDENNRAWGGKAGDQTGRELVIQDWYHGGWSAVFRAKDTLVANKIAIAAELACLNDNIGYNQGRRTTLYEQAKKVNWDLSKVINKCECDCSSLVAVCVNSAGIKISKDMYTGNQKSLLLATGKFDLFTDIKYLIKPNYLQQGDILLCPGHTAIVIHEDIIADKAKSFNSALSGTYCVTASKLNVRQGAGTHKRVITTIKNGTIIKCYGYYTKHSEVNWLYVQFTSNTKQYTGFVSMNYLNKIS